MTTDPVSHQRYAARPAGSDDHHRGLAHDLEMLGKAAIARRRALGFLAGAGTLALFGCGGGATDVGSAAASEASSGSTTTPATTSPATGTTTASASCSVIPEETEGPYPADGSNTANGAVANALMLSGIVRSDIRSRIAGATGVAAGVLLTVTIELVNTNATCADLAGYAVYLWHCDREGRYSLYSAGVIGENYLRGVQVTASDGTVTFTTVFPGCYSGRMPHMHFEIYRDANTATAFSNKLKTSQIALPDDICSTVYANASGYSASLANLARISFATDDVFSDGVSAQLATVTGSVANGYAARLVVGITI